MMVCALLIRAIPVWSADGPLEIRNASAELERSRIRATTEMVMINATILDRNDHIITGIQPQQISVVEEGVPQRIRSFGLEQSPVSMAVLIDLSGSMTKPFPHVREALARFSAGLVPGDEYMTVTFRDRPQVRIPFTSDPALLEHLAADEQPDGSTALIDALVLALHEVKEGRNARKAVIILSDGVERGSRYTWKELRSIVREAGVPIYAFMLPGLQDEDFDYYEMGRIVEESGGRFVEVGKARQFPEQLDRLEVHQQYVIGYVPTNQNRDGKFRRVKLELARTGEKMRVYWRHGYYAPR